MARGLAAAGVLAVLALATCGDGSSRDGSVDADADADTDSDTDSGTDSDGDADGDAGADADPDGDEAGDADSEMPDGSFPCRGGLPPTLGTVTVEELHAELEAKDFLLINVASAPSIPQTDAVITYSDTAALVAFIGPVLTTRVVVYCQSGGRSRVAGEALVAEGYCAIRNLQGGKSAWVAAGYELAP